MRLQTTAQFLLLVSLLTSSAFSQGSVVLDQQPNFALITYSDASCGYCGSPPLGTGQQVVADDFVIQTNSVFQLNQVVVWGGHSVSGPQPDLFTVSLHSDATEVLPHTNLYTESAIAFTSQPTGVVVYGSAVFEYTLTLATPQLLPSGTYWVSVYNDTTGGTSTWGIVSGDLDIYNGRDGFAFSDVAPGPPWYPDGYGTAGAQNKNFALQVIGSGAIVGGPVSNFCFGATCPCGNNDAYAGCANSTGAGGHLSFAGSASVGAADLQITGNGLLPGKSAWLFAGSLDLNLSGTFLLGDGVRCAGGALQRMGLRQTDATGAAQWSAIDATTYGWMPGDTRFLQVWYADLSASVSPCGVGSNVSDGVRVDWQP